MKKILVVEDEEAIREFVVINLRRSGYEVVDVANAEEALEVFDSASGDFFMALIDIMMPGMDGFALCKELRKRSRVLGIIILSAKTQEMDKVNGLMLGADDYITKPFSPSELTARVDAVNRRLSVFSDESGAAAGEELVSGPFVLNSKSRTLLKNGTDVDLTQVEFQIMELFMQRQNEALDRNEMLNRVWGENYFGDIKIVDVNIRRLRMKIEEDPSNPRHLLTVWGFGYKWVG